MRPPWALTETAFVEACTRCGECVRQCPEQILKPGIAGFPERVAEAGECSFCGDCVRACAPQALVRETAPAWSWLAAIGSSCLTHKGIVCQSCGETCPTRAIRFAPAAVRRPVVDASLCNACGACLPGCPSAAIKLIRISTNPAAAP